MSRSRRINSQNCDVFGSDVTGRWAWTDVVDSSILAPI
jgi:hypothetical protein